MQIAKDLSVDVLYTYRKDLVCWQSKGPIHTLEVLSELQKNEFTRDAMLGSKIIKTVKNLIKQLREGESIPNFTKDQIDQIDNKLYKLYQRLKEIRAILPKVLEPSGGIEQKGDILFQVPKDEPYDPQSAIVQRRTTDYLEQQQREKFRDTIVNEVKKIYKKLVDEQGDIFVESINKSEIDIDTRIFNLCTEFESKFYTKHFDKGEQNFYRDDLKTMIAYLRKDKSGQVLVRLLNCLFPINQAILLHIADWGDKKLFEKQKLHEFDANYYRDLRFKEMTQAQGQNCPRCHNDYLYLIDEKQTRRADEPSTKFYECFACGNKIRH